MRRFWSDLLASLYNIRDGIVKKKQELDEERAACEAEKEELRGQVADLEEELANAESEEPNVFPHITKIVDGFILYKYCTDGGNVVREATTFTIDKTKSASENCIALQDAVFNFYGRFENYNGEYGTDYFFFASPFSFDENTIDDIADAGYELFVGFEKSIYYLSPLVVYGIQPTSNLDGLYKWTIQSTISGDVRYINDYNDDVYEYIPYEDNEHNQVYHITDFAYGLAISQHEA